MKEEVNIIPDCINEPIKSLATPASSEIGQTLADLLYMATGHIHLVADKSRLKNQAKLEQFKIDLQDAISKKNEDVLVEPKLQVVGPAFERVQYCLEEPEIREMFKNLIANSADKNYQTMIHPSFSEIITHLSPLDAQNLMLFRTKDSYPIVNYRHLHEDMHYNVLLENAFLANFNAHEGSLTFLKLQAASLDSLSRQGLINICHQEWLTNSNLYSPFEETPVFENFKAQLDRLAKTSGESEQYGKSHIDLEKGLVRITNLGRTFLSVCCPSTDSE